MGTEFRIEVSEDSDANGVTHVVIVLEHVGVVGESRLEAWCGAAAEKVHGSGGFLAAPGGGLGDRGWSGGDGR
jgi:hypothetical protein